MRKKHKRLGAMVAGTGTGIPTHELTNADLEKMVDTSDEWIRTRTGILSRKIVENGVLASDLATEASKEAIDNAGITAEDVDLIILATITTDVKFPATACYLQTKIGAVNAAAFDISAACSGFLYGLSIGSQFLENGQAKNILVIGTEVLSSMVDWKDRNTCVLFGDGAGACVLKRSDGERGVLSHYTKSDGKLSQLLVCDGYGVKHPPGSTPYDPSFNYIQMQGRDVFKHAVRCMGDAAERVIKEASLTVDDVDLLIPHQANFRIIEAISKRVNIPMERVYTNLERYGNTSAASIPIALHEARQEGRLSDGDICVMVAFGGGFTWAAAAIQF